MPKSWLMQRSKPPSYSIAPGKQGRRYLALAVFKLITSSRNARARLAERAAPGECDVVKRSRNRFILIVAAAVVRLGRTG